MTCVLSLVKVNIKPRCWYKVRFWSYILQRIMFSFTSDRLSWLVRTFLAGLPQDRLYRIYRSIELRCCWWMPLHWCSDWSNFEKIWLYCTEASHGLRHSKWRMYVMGSQSICNLSITNQRKHFPKITNDSMPAVMFAGSHSNPVGILQSWLLEETALLASI